MARSWIGTSNVHQSYYAFGVISKSWGLSLVFSCADRWGWSRIEIYPVSTAWSDDCNVSKWFDLEDRF